MLVLKKIKKIVILKNNDYFKRYICVNFFNFNMEFLFLIFCIMLIKLLIEFCSEYNRCNL